MDLNQKLKQLPNSPGVYKMIDALGDIIYVGKAKNLKNRVTQYFRNRKNRSPKVTEMVGNIHDFEYMVTDTELDAFLEECRMIREIKPRYNKLMKNYKKYVYIKIPLEEYPKVLIVNERDDDGATYFGPFTSLHQVEDVVSYLNDFYPIRKCSSPRLGKKISGCLYSQLGSCLGVCTGQVSHALYGTYIEKIQLLLNGNDTGALDALQERLEMAVENLEFEKAAQYRNYYLGLQHIIQKQQLVQASRKNRNILAVEFVDESRAKLFFIRGNKLLYREVLDLAARDSIELVQYLKKIIREKFLAGKSGTQNLTRADIDEAQIIYSYLKKKRKEIVSFWIPSSRLKKEASSLDATVRKIVGKIFSVNHPSV